MSSAEPKDHYEAMGLHKSASQDDIRKAYKKLAMQYHPDRNADEGHRFKYIAAAYEVLSDPEKRSRYDKYGDKGLQEGADMSDLFSQFFGGGHGDLFEEDSGPSRTKNIKITLTVSLEELYNGAVRKEPVTRSIICPPCSGSGGKKGAKRTGTCGMCQGQGREVFMSPFGGFALGGECDQCEGSGKVFKKKDQCGSCKGSGRTKSTQMLDVEIDKGMTDGDHITLKGQASQEKGKERGDVVFILDQLKHERFIRKGDDLAFEHTLTLTEALAGFTLVISHLDGRELVVRPGPGVVTRPGSMYVVPDEGIPRNTQIFLKGNLLIHCSVIIDLPQHIQSSPSHLKEVGDLLGWSVNSSSSGEQVEMVDADPQILASIFGNAAPKAPFEQGDDSEYEDVSDEEDDAEGDDDDEEEVYDDEEIGMFEDLFEAFEGLNQPPPTTSRHRRGRPGRGGPATRAAPSRPAPTSRRARGRGGRPHNDAPGCETQ